MTYREILQLYRQGKLEEEKEKEVAAEIEKQDAISEYLFEETSLGDFDELTEKWKHPDNEKEEADDAEAEKEFVKMVNQSIRKAFLKMGLAVGTGVLFIVLFVIFALPHIVSLFYYEPDEIVAENEWNKTNRISLDVAVYTELFVPGYYRNDVLVEDCGYGKYDICINQTISPTGAYTNLGGVIHKNRLMLYDVNIIKRPVDNAFMRTEDTPEYYFTTFENEETGEVEYIGAAGTVEAAKEALNELNENDYYIAYVTLDKLMNYEQFMDWFGSLDIGWQDLWCSVYAEDESKTPVSHNIGFCPFPSGKPVEYDANRYPYLSLIWEDEEVQNDEEILKTHFLSMLQYMSEQETFLKMMGEETTGYQAIMEAIKEDGIRLNGFAVVTKKKDLLALSKEEKAYYIYTVPMR